ncbi:hypothetical protein FACS189443_6880 [Planctomycetales bacterium]|nr:hypothetical protein FACS189443_6880 [Planctomycetales bacterium]
MQKKTNLHLFKTVAVTLFVVATVLLNSVAWGQQIRICARIGNQDIFFYRPCTVSSSDSSYTTEKHTTANPRFLSHIVPGTLTYPSSVSYNGQTCNTVDAVDAFWEYHVFAGYSKISGATPSQNCHGYSTGKGRWLSDFQKLIDDDWTPHSFVDDLVSGAVYGNSGHSVRIDAVILIVTQTRTRYEVETSQKYRDSGVYAKTVSATNGPSTEVALPLKGTLTLGPPTTISAGTVNVFYVK